MGNLGNWRAIEYTENYRAYAMLDGEPVRRVLMLNSRRHDLRESGSVQFEVAT